MIRKVSIAVLMITLMIVVKTATAARNDNVFPYYETTVQAVHAIGGDIHLVATVGALMKVESNFNRLAKSHMGAMGLTQFMPSTGALYGLRRKNDFYTPKKSIMAGAKHLADLAILAELRRSGHKAKANKLTLPLTDDMRKRWILPATHHVGNLRYALQGYNAGRSIMFTTRHPAVRRYARKVLRWRMTYRKCLRRQEKMDVLEKIQNLKRRIREVTADAGTP